MIIKWWKQRKSTSSLFRDAINVVHGNQMAADKRMDRIELVQSRIGSTADHNNLAHAVNVIAEKLDMTAEDFSHGE